MPISGVNFSIGVDAAKGIAGIKNFQGQFNDMSNKISGEISKKLKYMFNAAAIEEATRRTGQWAQQIDQSSKALGISNEMLQTLQMLASKTGAPEDAVVGMFENIAKARQEAINGNVEMQQSFARLGISMEEVFNPKVSTSKFVSDTLSKMPKITPEMSGYKREAIEAVTGTPAGTLAGIQKGLEGTTLEGQKAAGLESGALVSNENISALSAQFAELTTSLKETVAELAPTLSVLIVLFKLLVDAFNGIVRAITGVWKIFSGLLTGDLSKMGDGGTILASLFTGFIAGIAKLFTSLFDLLVRGLIGIAQSITKMIGKIPGLGKITEGSVKELEKLKETFNMTKYVDTATEFYSKKGGLNKGDINKGAAVADIAATIATAGEAGVAEGLQTGASSLGKMASKVGMTNLEESLIAKASKFGDVAKGKGGLFGDKTITDKVSGRLADISVSGERKALREKVFEKIVAGEEMPSGVLNDALKMARRRSRIRQFIKRGIGAGAIGAGIGAGTQLVKGAKGTPGEEFGAVFGQKAQNQFANIGGGETSMLKMGGVFGSAFTSRMIKLNEQMVSLLSQITANTAQTKRGEPYTSPSMTGLGGNAGGI